MKRWTRTVEEMLSQAPGWVHMAGIGGVGMAGLALLLQKQGWRVDGCDASEGPLLTWLRNAGIPCGVGHHADHLLARPDWLIRSPAVSVSDTELVKARDMTIPIHDRGEVLPRLLRRYQTMAVAGTHGKTTTSSMIAWLIAQTNVPVSWCIGGLSPCLGAVARAESSGLMVVEADESDGTLQWYEPEIAVITNMDLDHVDFFRATDRQLEVYRRFAAQARHVVYPSGDPVVARAVEGILSKRSFGFDEQADVRAVRIELQAGASSFELLIGKQSYGLVVLSVPGRHNILNALAAIAAVSIGGVEQAHLLQAMATFQLPRRRFDVLLRNRMVTVISDYAHHPVEIDALLAQVRLLKPPRVIGVFQPHRYSRTKAFRADFVRSLQSLDYLVLAPVYSASEALVVGGTSTDLHEAFIAAGVPSVELARDLDDAWSRLQSAVCPGDVVLIIGAGDVEQIGWWAARDWAEDKVLS